VTLLEQAKRLKDLTENVEEAADAERAARALEAVRGEVMMAKNAVMGYGLVPDHGQDVPADALQAVRDGARALIEVLAPLKGANDAVLVAYGANQDTATTGVLGSVGQRARALGHALREAQRQVLVAWAERVWPGTDLARLEALAAVETPAKALLDLRVELLAPDTGDVQLGAAALQHLALRVAESEGAAADLRDKAPPAAVIAFYDRLEQALDGVRLSEVDPSVLQWLVEHAAGDLSLQRTSAA
jgi:hypothetical protein